MQAIKVLGLVIPEAGPLFLIASPSTCWPA
jgi:hypothetical protein